MWMPLSTLSSSLLSTMLFHVALLTTSAMELPTVLPLSFCKYQYGSVGSDGFGAQAFRFRSVMHSTKPLDSAFPVDHRCRRREPDFYDTSSTSRILAGASSNDVAIDSSDALMRNSGQRHQLTPIKPVLRPLQSSTRGLLLRRAVQPFDRTQVILAAKKNGAPLGEEGPSPDKPEPPEFQPATLWYQLFIDGETDNQSYDASIPKKRNSRVLITEILKAVRKAQKNTLKNFDSAQTQVYAYGNGEEVSRVELQRGDEWLPSLQGGDSPKRPIVVKAMTQPEMVRSVLALGMDDTAVRKAALRARLVLASQNGQAYVDSIMAEGNMEDVASGQGMRVMRNVSMIGGDVTRDIVIRADTEPFWQECIRATESGYRVCAVGTPGIGKTTSILYLIHLLLKDKKAVVYLLRTNRATSFYYEFIPSPDNAGVYNCRVYPETENPQDIPCLQDKHSTFIVDPGDTSDSCNPDTTFIAQVIIVTSPDEEHWGGSAFLKSHADLRVTKGGIFLFYPLWSLSELTAARSILNSQLPPEERLSESDVNNRFYEVGGIPRHVFGGFLSYKAWRQKMTTSLQDLTFDQARKYVTNQVGRLVTLEKSQPPSNLMGLASVETDYSGCVGVPVSLMAQSNVYEKFLVDIWERIETGQAVELFERYCMFRLTGTSQESYQTRRCVGKQEQDYYNIQTIPLGGCRDWMYAVDIVEAARNRLNVLFVPTSLSNELIDFVYSELRNGRIHFCAVQVTTKEKHDAKVTQIERFLSKIGDATATIYYMVLPSKFDDFVTEPRNPTVNLTMDQQESLEILHVRVPSPIAPIEPSSEN